MNPSTLFFYLLFIIASVLAGATLPGLPSQIYGVNLGSWLLIESWMLPDEWAQMGGQQCGDCSTCIATEFALAQAYPDTVDATFNTHWETWFTQDHVDQLVSAGINAVRIPLGYWIVEALINRTTEFYPKGGILQLHRGLGQLKAAGIAAILDHHALPGVATPNQSFAGRCTTDVQFYTPPNYHRALVWTAVMTALSHVDPNFSTVASIEAMNEPIMDANQTPGLGQFEKDFVQTMRTMEAALGISNSTPSSISSEISQVMDEAIPIIEQIASQLNITVDFEQKLQNKLKSSLSSSRPLVANFQDVIWQHNNPPNPADAAMGPQAYDSHLYWSFGGVADPNEDAYLTSICNLNRVQADAALGNSPLWFGEWGLATQFDASDDFLKKWADAQKLMFGKGAGWLFCNFRIEDSDAAAPIARQWSYLKGVELGYLTQDPSQINDPNVCAPYIAK